MTASMHPAFPESFAVDCRDEAATDRLGACIADSLVHGVVIELNGQLGSGKTRLVRAICAALGIDTTQVNSPTFVLLQLYTDGRIPVAHFDTYRLGDTDEFMAIGAEEFTSSSDWICLIEWGERVAVCLPDDRLRIDISATSADARHVVLTSTGGVSSALLQRIRQNTGQPHG
jgi:tRNA threonylcarbamoyladenosine biosynthesis protein TsaE